MNEHVFEHYGMRKQWASHYYVIFQYLNKYQILKMTLHYKKLSISHFQTYLSNHVTEITKKLQPMIYDAATSVTTAKSQNLP